MHLQLKQDSLIIGDDDPLLPQLLHAINHADAIEISVAFILNSGLRLIIDSLLDALKRHVKIKLLSSDYLGVTDPVALRQLMNLVELGADVRIFQTEDYKTSFHMKSYIFVKTNDEGETLNSSTLNKQHRKCEDHDVTDACAFIGSNNISLTALTKGHEWCFRHDFKLPSTSSQAKQFFLIRDAFYHIFSHEQVVKLNHDWISAYINRRPEQARISFKKSDLNLVNQNEEITPTDIQLEALQELNTSRDAGFKRGLIVLATGMGKTWLSAFDAKQMVSKKVLFVAHREEILFQAKNAYAQLWVEKSIGFYNGKTQDDDVDLLFASIQTLGKQAHLNKFAKDHFDYIVVDEFHHASAPVYRNLLDYFVPKFLLGLTATPERTDQADILGLCDNNLVYECNLVDGINDKSRLVPFSYYGIWDEEVNYQSLPWRNGRFDPNHLEHCFASEKRAAHIYKHWLKRRQICTLGFCISKKHADYMAEYFCKQGVNAAAVYSDSALRRSDALNQLEAGILDVLFCVDLFNEGMDLPCIDTILMLRPSDSKILFLQQLGRGLRRYEGKEYLSVLDFIGNHHSFLNKPYALLSCHTIAELRQRQIKQFSSSLADGCFVNYDIEITDFWQQLSRQQGTSAKEDFEQLENQLGYRPSANEFYLANQRFDKVNKQHGSWFELAVDATLFDMSDNERQSINLYRDFLLYAVQITSMAKSFKAIMLEGFLKLNGFVKPPKLSQLAEKSWQILNHYPDLHKIDLPDKQQKLKATDKAWLSYWKGNPIKAFTNVDKKAGKAWFVIEDDCFKANIDVEPYLLSALHNQVQELVDYKLTSYKFRKDKSSVQKIQPDKTELSQLSSSHSQSANFAQKEEANVISLPFFPNIKIACGHFKTGIADEMEQKTLPNSIASSHPHLNPTAHFLAKASGNSMNGGKRPINDGDLLLLEWITGTSAGSISNQTLVIEKLDEADDSQYLLRVIKKQTDGTYLLKANNPVYQDMVVKNDFRQLARLIDIVD